MDAICIKVCVTPQGIMVSSEPLTEQPQGEPVGSIDEALEKVRAMAGGEMGGEQGGMMQPGGEQQAEQDFTAGFA